jgi:predicted nucleotide-binding protein
MAKNNGGQAARVEKARSYVSQADVPAMSLDKALKVPSAIGDNYGYKPTPPLQVAMALEIQPSSSGFRMVTGAAIAYGLTAGGYNADAISITPLGLRIVRPTSEGDDFAAKREALLRPRVIREFLQKYNNAPVPKDAIAQNVLLEMGVPQGRVGEVFKLIIDGAQAVGFLREIKDRKYVDLTGAEIGFGRSQDQAIQEIGDEEASENSQFRTLPPPIMRVGALGLSVDARSRRVFITHGKNKAFIEPIKKLLSFGELEAVVAAEKQTVSQPVPEKVMEDMRSCGAAIIHVEDERRLLDKEVKEHVILNENVLIEIGAAMALYGRRFILVVKDGVQVPSNLQGLFEVRYDGETLDGTATIKLMEAINDMKKRSLP